MPDDYKRELCAIFAAPLGPANTPLCSLVCDSIREHHARLHSCVLFELQRFHSRLHQEGWARYQLQKQMESLSDGPTKSMLFGFMLPLEYWLNSKDLYTRPSCQATDALFVSHSLVLMTAFPGVDYLALLLAASADALKAKTDKTAFNTRRK